MVIQVSFKIDFIISYFWFFRGFMLKGNKQRDGLPKETSSHVRILPRTEEEHRARQTETGSNRIIASVIQARQERVSTRPIFSFYDNFVLPKIVQVFL